ncbi:divergent PAP2 family protein [Candidatus Gracilibacteria bacterium]|nr:divergent PAP2 family protein [Candidatus Gracilibacteria bacterium]
MIEGGNMFYDNLILIPAITFLVTVFLKGCIVRYKTGKIDLARSLGSGGMPSVHSAVVVSLATAMALKHGMMSDYFAVALTFTVIIIYDAMNVRFQAGQHAAALNKSLGQKKYNESLGHLPSEAFAGSILGIIIAVLLSVL